MSKKTAKKTTKPFEPTPTAKPAGNTYPVEQEDLERQQQRVKRAAAAGAGALQTPTAAVAAEPLPAPAPAKPLAPLGAAWPTSVPPAGADTNASRPAPTPQKTAVTDMAAPRAPISAAPSQSAAQSAKSEKPTVHAPAQTPAAAKAVKVTFAFSNIGAKQVSLCGEFNGWSPSATPLRRHDDGRWDATVALPPGQYQYKFLVDGEWIPDPAATKNVPNQFGSLNSVIEVRT